MKILLTGANGQLGRELGRSCPDGWELLACDRDGLDITSADQVSALVAGESPDLIINAAAYTAVDRAESEPEIARRVNVEGPANLAAAVAAHGGRIIQLSTDFVFDGTADTPYSTAAPTHPVGVYGATKLAGERAVLATAEKSAVVLRTAWVYSSFGHNFVKTMLRLMSDRDQLGVVADQCGTPTWTRSIAAAVWRIAANEHLHGVFHWTDGGQASWYEFACAIQQEGLACGVLDHMTDIRPLGSEEYTTAAGRPAYSVLDCTDTRKALSLPVVPWREQLSAMLQELMLMERSQLG
jgi:dTDP-4-dehydrorhamnose reductase